MSMQRTTAIVLRRTNYGEADRVLQLLTPEGQRAVIAKGVRREKSRLAGAVELFAISDVVIRQGRSELGVLTQARLTKYYQTIVADYDRLQAGYAAIQLVAQASRMLDEPAWYEVLRLVYEGLDQPSVPIMLTQAWLAIHYAALQGYELNLLRDVVGQPLHPERRYMYDGSERGLRLSDQGDITAAHIKLLRLLATCPPTVVGQVGGVLAILPECWLVARQHAEV